MECKFSFGILGIRLKLTRPSLKEKWTRSASITPRPTFHVSWTKAAKGESFIIAKAGKPLVKVIPLYAPEPSEMRRTGFMTGEISVPDDFNEMGEAEIERTFRVE